MHAQLSFLYTPSNINPANASLTAARDAYTTDTITLSCGATFNSGDATSTVSLCGNTVQVVRNLAQTSGGGNVDVLVFRNLRVTGTRALTGSRPVIILAYGTVAIEGTVQANASGATVGAGGGVATCSAVNGTNRTSSSQGASGGAGGGFGTAGGNSGNGHSGASGVSGGGLQGSDALSPLRGGCSGGSGGQGRTGSGGRAGGGAGGALQIAAAGLLRISGKRDTTRGPHGVARHARDAQGPTHHRAPCATNCSANLRVRPAACSPTTATRDWTDSVPMAS